MRPSRLAQFSVALALSAAGLAIAGEKAAPPPAPAGPPNPDALLPQDHDYVVHEWGTFTGFAGSDGVGLEFRTTVDSDLPAFVIDRPKQAFMCERRDVAYSRGLATKGTLLSRQRMETPVTYFYTDKERIVDATVEFPKGLLTEFYPPVRQFGPAYQRGQPEPIAGSWLRWGKVRLIPAAQALGKTGVDASIPAVRPGEGEHYAYARETDSAHVQLTDPAMMRVDREKFLFYRGVGNFDLPVSVRAAGAGRFVLAHSGKTPLRFAFVVSSDGGRISFAKYENLGPSTELTLPETGTESTEALGEAMAKALVGEGLYEKEARAMIKTWRSSWFGEPGTRVLYALPQSDTDRMLPLKLLPAPKELLRVMVGRLEVLTPEQERRVAGLVARLGNADPAVRQQTADEIRKFGRFAEPALTRVVQIAPDPETRAAAETLLREVLAGRGIAAGSPVEGAKGK